MTALPALLRVVTANVLHGRSAGEGSDGAVDLQRYAAGLAALRPDVLALQEVDLRQPRSHGVDLAALAAQATGLAHWRFLPAYLGVRGRAWERAGGTASLDGARPAYGVALLSRYPVTAWREMRLPWLRPACLARALGARAGDEPRVALGARLDTPIGALTVVATHLSHLRRWNAVQLAALRWAALRAQRSELSGRRGRCEQLLLMGDLNLPGPAAARITGLLPLASAPTFPARSPDRQIDHLLARGLRSRSAGAVVMPFSDHRALVADIEAAPA